MSERKRYVVSYDIGDDKRLRRVYKAMRGFGDHVQLSVFICELSAREKAEMIATLVPLIHHEVDQILIADLGPAEGRGSTCISSLGRPFTCPERHAIIV